MEMNCSAANQEDMSVFLKSKSEFLLYFFGDHLRFITESRIIILFIYLASV